MPSWVAGRPGRMIIAGVSSHPPIRSGLARLVSKAGGWPGWQRRRRGSLKVQARVIGDHAAVLAVRMLASEPSVRSWMTVTSRSGTPFW